MVDWAINLKSTLSRIGRLLCRPQNLWQVIMASQWYSLVSQKLFMARTLLKQAESVQAEGHEQSEHKELSSTQALQKEAGIQGTIELTLRARRLLLIMIARVYQQKNSEPDSLDALVQLLGAENPETIELMELTRSANNWWNHLDQLETAQGKPPVTRKTVSADNIIAVSAETGPDRSPAALHRLLDALKQFADTLEDRHSEW